MRIARTGSRRKQRHQARDIYKLTNLQTGKPCRAYFQKRPREIVTASSRTRHRISRLVFAAASTNRLYRNDPLAGAPIATHARHDHGAARPVFLHISCAAVPHRIRAGIITRIDAGFPIITRIDAQACHRPSDAALRGRVGGLRRLHRLYPLLCGLSALTGRRQTKSACKSNP
jgi:hypothetical protein